MMSATEGRDKIPTVPFKDMALGTRGTSLALPPKAAVEKPPRNSKPGTKL